MEGISANVYKGIRGYWKKKGYKKLNKNHQNHGRADPVNPGSEMDPNPVHGQGQGRRRRRRFFRVKITRRMPIWRKVVGMPKKWLTNLRDAYVKMMLNLANSGLGVGGAATGFGVSVDYGYGYGSYRSQLKEYDEKMIVEIYKSLMIAQGQLGVGGAAPNKVNHLRTSPPKVTISAR
ncbi:hypothetical protein SOVF_119820 [Spinacia oleracea]|uniref:Uncharacterized protein n=1 Tax=Spinacia oleracea TaxID=3562 RepID=A0A9R0IT46_SPIOL|nr:uncharacterized protein LOC110794443 [Spinacia oleracea]KNA13037.1 hypothetical protein SOVF_119820 [Spinacia oleracea]